MRLGYGLGLGSAAPWIAPSIAGGSTTLDDATLAATAVAPATGSLAVTLDDATATGTIEPFDITTLAWSSLWAVPFAVPWLATASAGVSATTGSLVTNGFNPTSGTTQNGYTPGQFTAASTQHLKNATAITTLVTVSAGTMACLFYSDTAAADNSSNGGIDNPLMITDTNFDVGLSFSDAGVGAFAYSSGYKRRLATCSAGAWHLAVMRWDGTNLGLTIDSAAEVTVACSTLTIMTGTVWVGRSHLPSYFNGRMALLGTIASKISDANITNLRQYCNTKFALSL